MVSEMLVTIFLLLFIPLTCDCSEPLSVYLASLSYMFVRTVSSCYKRLRYSECAGGNTKNHGQMRTTDASVTSVDFHYDNTQKCIIMVIGVGGTKGNTNEMKARIQMKIGDKPEEMTFVSTGDSDGIEARFPFPPVEGCYSISVSLFFDNIHTCSLQWMVKLKKSMDSWEITEEEGLLMNETTTYLERATLFGLNILYWILPLNFSQSFFEKRAEESYACIFISYTFALGFQRWTKIPVVVNDGKWTFLAKNKEMKFPPILQREMGNAIRTGNKQYDKFNKKRESRPLFLNEVQGNLILNGVTFTAGVCKDVCLDDLHTVILDVLRRFDRSVLLDELSENMKISFILIVNHLCISLHIDRCSGMFFIVDSHTRSTPVVGVNGGQEGYRLSHAITGCFVAAGSVRDMSLIPCLLREIIFCDEDNIKTVSMHTLVLDQKEDKNSK